MFAQEHIKCMKIGFLPVSKIPPSKGYPKSTCDSPVDEGAFLVINDDFVGLWGNSLPLDISEDWGPPGRPEGRRYSRQKPLGKLAVKNGAKLSISFDADAKEACFEYNGKWSQRLRLNHRDEKE